MPTMHYLMYYGFIDGNLSNTWGDYITVAIARDSSGGDEAKKKIPDADVWVIRDDLIVPMGLVTAAGGDVSSVVANVLAAAKGAIASAPTTLEEDMAELEAGTHPPWMRPVLLMRVRWKSLLSRLATGAKPPVPGIEAPRTPPNVDTLMKTRHLALYEIEIAQSSSSSSSSSASSSS